MFPLMSFLPSLIREEGYNSLHCIFQSEFVLNTRSIKIHRRSNIKVLITLLLEKEFLHAAHLLVNDICLRSVIGRHGLTNVNITNVNINVTTHSW